MKRIAIASALVALSFLVADPASGVVTKTWTVESYKDWDAGDAEHAVISSLGEVRPGWSTTRHALEVDAVWSSTRAGDGSILIGTDDKGAIYRWSGGKLAKLTSIPDVVAVVSLAAGPGNTVYAGTLPGGQVWKVDVGTGKASKLAELKDAETVWSLGVSRDEKTVYAGTGPKGHLFAVDAGSGKATLAYDTGDKRVMSIAVTSDGAVWAGTSSKGLVFRYDPKKRSARAMADFAGNEVTALAASSDGVIAIANDFDEPSTTGVKTADAVKAAEKKEDGGESADKPDTGSKPGADAATPAAAKIPRKNELKGKGAVYRVYGDSRLEQLHALTQTYFTALAVTETGRIFAAAGDKGRVYMIDTDDAISTAFDVDERIVAELSYDAKDGLSFATADAAAFYRTTGAAKKSSYTSKVWDAGATARFGKLAWRGDGKLRVETRTGNTAKPGKGWSGWSTPRGTARGGGASAGGKVASPSGRYFQFRVRFDDADAVLRAAALYYLPQNRATEIESVALEPSGAGKDLTTTKSGAAKPRSPIVKVTWKVKNPDGDTTAYKLSVRREGEVLWRSINTGKEPLTKTTYSWNTETFQDGWYRLRVSASDRPANSADRSLETHRTSVLFRVDNARPIIDGINVTYPRASARAVDALSAIAEAAYSVDDGPWLVGATQDGLFDEAAEMLRIELPAGLEPGVHTLSIRVADDVGNIGSASVSFRVK